MISIRSRSGPGIDERSLATLAFTVLLVAFGATFFTWRFVRRSREQLAIVSDANRLRSMLQSMQTNAGAGEAVEIPAAVLEDVARIERAQIAREQRDAIVASAGAAKGGYWLLVARDVSAEKGLLDPTERAAVEDLIDELTADPHPAGAEPTADGLLRVRTPDGAIELHYRVDEGARSLQVVTLGRTDTGAIDHLSAN